MQQNSPHTTSGRPRPTYRVVSSGCVRRAALLGRSLVSQWFIIRLGDITCSLPINSERDVVYRCIAIKHHVVDIEGRACSKTNTFQVMPGYVGPNRAQEIAIK